ncbi:MAG: DUF2232 domain-containing protein [Gemmatimonadales bacterium]
MLAGFLLLAPPLYVLGPLGLLLLLSRPRTAREWFWIVTAVIGSWLWLRAGSGLADEVIRASAVLLTGAFVTLALAWRGPVPGRALGAVVLAVLALAAWVRVLGLGSSEIVLAIEEQIRQRYQGLLDAARRDPGSSAELRALLQQLVAGAPGVARLYPGMLALLGIAGTSIAWRWYHRIAAAPVAPPPPPFRDFRFNDHLVWGAIVTLALVLVPVPGVPAVLVANVLLVWVGLYAARGAAVAATMLAPASVPLKAIASLLALLLAPFTLGLFVSMGLADTWLDIRGRLRRRAPPPEGSSP